LARTNHSAPPINLEEILLTQQSVVHAVDQALDLEYGRPRPPWATPSLAARVNAAYCHSFGHFLEEPLSLYFVSACVLAMSRPTLSDATTTFDAALSAVEAVVSQPFPPPLGTLEWQVLTLDVLEASSDWVKRCVEQLSFDDRELVRLLLAAEHVTLSRDLLAGTLDSLVARAILARLARIVHLVAEEIAEKLQPDDPFGLFEEFGDPNL